MKKLKNYILLLSFIFLLILASCSKDDPTASPTPTPTPTGTKSTAKDITKFSFAALSPVVDATIDATTKAITSTVPSTTDLTKLVPTITLSDKATVSPVSGVAQDFSKEVAYTVTAEDGTAKTYSITVTVPKPTTITIDCNNIPEVWEDLGDGVDYIVKCNLRIDKNIVIKPGVKIHFDASGGFYVNGDNASLNMVGTKDKPIILEGITQSAGSWKGVFLGTTNLKNQWEFVTLRFADGTIFGAGQKAGLQISSLGKVSLKNCTFSDNFDYGIAETNGGAYSNSLFYAFENNIFTNNKKSGIKICVIDMGALDSKSSFVNNGQKYIEVVTARNENDMTVQKLDAPYRITDFLTIRAKLTLNAGVSIEFGSDAGLEVSSIKTAVLIANGTSTDPVKLVGYLPNTKAVWQGITISSNNIENKLNYCIIDGAGSKVTGFTNFDFWFDKKATSAVNIDGTGYKESYRATVTNCVVSNSGGYGIAYSIYSKDAVTVKDNTFKDNAKANIIEFSY